MSIYKGNTLVTGNTLPTQTGQSGKFLTTDGSSASWATISAGGGSEVIQNISVVSGTTVSIASDKAIYSKTISADTTFTFDVSGLGTLTNKAVTFELYLDMPTTAYALTFPSTVTWVATPSFANTGKYLIIFKSLDGGTTWIGNLEVRQ